MLDPCRSNSRSQQRQQQAQIPSHAFRQFMSQDIHNQHQNSNILPDASDPTYHSPQLSSSFLPPPTAPPGAPFFIADVPIPDGFCLACVVLIRVSPALENSSQKSFLSWLGPFAGSPKDSQKSLRSGSAPPRRVVEEEAPLSPSTKRLNVVPALTTPVWRDAPRVPAVERAWDAMSASAS